VPLHFLPTNCTKGSKKTKKVLKGLNMSEEEKGEIIQYGMERMKVILISISVTLLIGYVFDILYQSIVFLLSFYPLRRYAGGYHAKTQKNCFLISFCIVIISLGMLRDVTQQGINILFISALINSIIIWYLAPIENLNKQLDKNERNEYRFRTRRVLLGENILLIIFFVLNKYNFVMGITISIGITSIALISGVIQNRKFSNMKISYEKSTRI